MNTATGPLALLAEDEPVLARTLSRLLAQAWPAERGPVEALHFEGGRLSLQRSGFADEQVEALRQRLASEGWTLQTEQGRLILNKAGR